MVALLLASGAAGCAGAAEIEAPAEGEVGSAAQELPVGYNDPDESCSYTYAMWPVPTNNVTMPGAYGVKWKAALKAIPAEPDYAFCDVKYPATAASCLNAQEADPRIFPNGDPGGTWSDNYSFVSGNGGNIDPEQIIIGAAMVMHHWKSPTFLTVKHQFSTTMSSADHATIAIRRININVESCESLTSLCEAQGFNTSSLAADAVDAPCVSAHGQEIELQSVEVAYWGPEPLAGQIGTATLSGAQFINAVNASAYGHQYTVDPPTEGDAERMRERVGAVARALKGRLFVRDQLGRPVRLTAAE